MSLFTDWSVDVDTLPNQQDASFSRDPHTPLEKLAPEACGTVHLYRLEDGRLLARRVDCRTKACPKCGPRLRGEYASGYAEVLAAAGPVYRQVVGPGWRKRPGAEYLRIPAPGGRLVVYTTAEQGDEVKTLTPALAADFAAMPSDRRNVSASTAWRRAYHAWREQGSATTSAPAEYLGQLRRTLEQVAIIARELGMFIGEAGEGALLLRDPPDAVTWRRFCALAGLYQQAAAA